MSTQVRSIPAGSRSQSGSGYSTRVTLTFVATRLQSVKLRGRSSFWRSTVKRQIPNIDSIIAGGDARLLKKGSSFLCALLLSLVGLVASTPLLAQYDSAQISGSVHDPSGAM